MNETNGEIAIRTALLSVSDKTGILEFAWFLWHGFRVKILAAPSTAVALGGIPITEIADPSVPEVRGGMIYVRGKGDDQSGRLRLGPIDMVVVNFCPFVPQLGVTYEDTVENIEIDSSNMLRIAAKNHRSVVPVCDPRDYKKLVDLLEAGDGKLNLCARKQLAMKVFGLTSANDRAIEIYLGSQC